ncbi:MAG: SGNH/GDSL hydrolase family protein [Chloroflexota bacterium]
MSKLLRNVTCLVIIMLALTGCNATAQAPLPAISTPAEPDTTTPSTQPTSTPTQPVAILAADPTQSHAVLPAGALSIVALGDSLTQGDGDESGLNGFPNRLADLIAVQRPGTKVINLGKSGWTANDLIHGVNGEPATLPQALEAKPDIVLVWIGSNNLWYLYEYGPEPMTAAAEQQDLEEFAASMDSILGQLSGSGAKIFVALLDDQSKRPVVANPPNPAEPAFSAITPQDLALMSKHVSALNEIIKMKAASYAAVTVDFYQTDIFTNPATLYSDGNHPNTAGYEIITNIWYKAIEPYLTR